MRGERPSRAGVLGERVDNRTIRSFSANEKEFSTSDDDHGVFGQLYFMNVLAVHFSTGLWFARVRAASRCVLVRLSWRTEMVRDRIANCSSVLVSLWFLSDL